MSATISKDRLSALVAKIREAKEQKPQEPQNQEDNVISYDKYGNLITLNSKQSEAVKLAKSGESFVVIGSAGTGKTTCMRAVIEAKMQDFVPPIDAPHKYLNPESPGIVIISYTRRAVSNIRRAVSEDFKGNCITYHKLMEYEPVFFTVNTEEGGEKKTMQFIPSRGGGNPLPQTIQTIIVEESSMLSVEYWNLLMNAMLHKVQVIFLGDIYQLPPVFGSAILGYKMAKLPTVELTEVYRQALNSPIISLAHDIKNGKGFMLKEKKVIESEDGKVTLHPWKKTLHPEAACAITAKFFKQAYKEGIWNPEHDIILMPFNKAYGTVEINRHIATFLASQSGGIPVFEIIAGFNKLYLRVGEKIMVDREDATVISIERNPTYLGKRPQEPSPHLDYWGADNSETPAVHHIDESIEDVDTILANLAVTEKEDKVNQASHKVTVFLHDSEKEVTLQTAGELNTVLLGYALTVHKAQGSEWRRVFCLFHASHATMLNRELLYTAVTRPREELYVICEQDTFMKGVKSQKIKGTTLKEKAEFFKGKALNPDVVVL